VTGTYAIATSQQNEEPAKSAALEQCQKKADAVQSPRKCELYAVGNTVVYAHGKPPLPPLPWIRHDPSTEKPYVTKDMPLVRDIGKTRLESYYVPGKKTKSIAVSPGGYSFPLSAPKRSRIRRAEAWNPAAPLPAFPA